jgi:hypothetical protein
VTGLQAAAEGVEHSTDFVGESEGGAGLTERDILEVYRGI